MTQVSEYELGRFQGEVNARLAAHDTGIEELKTGVAEVADTCTEIRMILANQNGLRSLAKTGGAGAGGVGLIIGLIEAIKALT